MPRPEIQTVEHDARTATADAIREEIGDEQEYMILSEGTHYTHWPTPRFIVKFTTDEWYIYRTEPPEEDEQ